MKNKIVLILSSIFFMASCKKDAVKLPDINLEAQKSIFSHLKAINDAKGGSISIVATSGFGKNSKKSYVLNASFVKDAQISSIDIDGHKFLPIQTNNFTSNDGNVLKSLFGKTINVSLQSDTTALQSRASSNLETSEPLEVSDGDSPTGSPSSIPRRVNLNWNGLNRGTVLILVIFNSQSVLNEDFTHNPSVLNHYEVPDNGSHILDETAFRGIPVGANVIVQVIRGRSTTLGSVGLYGSQAVVYAYSSATLITEIRP